MKFKGEGNTTVWDAQRDRELCRFEKGELETSDPHVCEALISLGYENDGDLPEELKPKTELDEEFEAMKVHAKELKIKGASQMKKEKLIEAIALAEKGGE